MYQPPHFREDRRDVLIDVMHRNSFASLATVQNDRPVIDHLPLVMHPEIGVHGVIRGHIAKANPIVANVTASGRAVAAFQGPQAYVSPAWYASKAEHGKVVPTWNYIVVQAAGTLTLHDDPGWLRAQVTHLTDKHEASRPAAWQVTDAPDEFIERQLRGIVGIELKIESLEGKWKLSQNRSQDDRRGVQSGLASGSSEDSIAMSALIDVPK